MLRIKIGTIDMYGAQGRDLHPKATDTGRSGVVQKYETEMCDGVDGAPATEIGLYTIKLDDNAIDVRVIEIMSYEVASVELVKQ